MGREHLFYDLGTFTSLRSPLEEDAHLIVGDIVLVDSVTQSCLTLVESKGDDDLLLVV